MTTERLADLFERATALAIQLDRAPWWRPRRRRRLRAALEDVAARADQRRAELGVNPDAPGLLEVLHDEMSKWA